jgi:hypothetical protein
MARPRKQPNSGADLAAIEGAEIDCVETSIGGHDGQNGVNADRPTRWLAMNHKALEVEHLHHPDKQVTGVFYDGDDAPGWWTGNHCECPVLPGEPAIRLHTGEMITL